MSDYGQMPKLAWVAVDVLSADPRYQRTIDGRRSKTNISRIVERFSWALFGAATVADTPEGYRVIDGQHRIEAARRLGIEEVPCLLVEALDLAAQARLFIDANRHRVSLTAVAIHHAAVAAGDETAVAIQHACADAGVEVMRYPVMARMMKPGQTLAIGSLGKILKQHGPEVLKATLHLVASHWPEPGGLSRDRLRAVAQAIAQTDAASVDKAIGRIGADQVDLAAERAAEAGLPRFRLMADAIAGQPAKPARMHRLHENASSPAPAARPAPRPAPAPAEHRIPDEVDELFTAPVNRRCERCRGLFKTRHVQRYRCDSCHTLEQSRAAAG